MKKQYGYSDLPIIKQSDVYYGKFKNNGNDSLAINGIGGVEFKLEDIPNTNISVTSINFIISTSEIIELSKFGNLDALVNGLDFDFNGNINFKTNEDIVLLASNIILESVRIGPVTVGIIKGRWHIIDIYRAGLEVNTNDFTITLNDDLSTLKSFKVSVSGIRLESNIWKTKSQKD